MSNMTWCRVSDGKYPPHHTPIVVVIEHVGEKAVAFGSIDRQWRTATPTFKGYRAWDVLGVSPPLSLSANFITHWMPWPQAPQEDA